MRLIVVVYNLILLASHISAQWQAYLLGYLQVDKGPYYNFQKDLGLSDFQVSIVVGSVYTFVNGFANLGFGILADQYPRKWLFVACTLAFTAMTFLESLCDTFVSILFARMGFALLMGSNIPLAVSLLSDYTLPQERGIAQSIYAAGVYLGVGMSSLSVLIDDHVGWRNCVRIICGISWGMAIPMFFLPEPERNATNKEAAMQELGQIDPDGRFIHLEQSDETVADGVPAMQVETETVSNQTREGAGHFEKEPRRDATGAPATVVAQHSHDPYQPLMKQQQVDKKGRDSLNNRSTSRKGSVAESMRSSVFEIDVADMSFCGRLRVLCKNSCFMYLVLAGALRFFGGYSLGFLSGKFFEDRFPDYTTEFSIMNAVIVIGGGLPASMIGGILSDRLEHRYGNIKGLIAGVGALFAIPFIIISYGWQPSFWGSIISYYVAYFSAEMWYGPSHAQINNMFPSEYQGFAVAAFNLGGAIAGTIATLTLGAIKTQLDTGDDEYNAKINGYILTGGVVFSYLTCGPLFIISGNQYSKQLEENKKKIAAEAMSQVVATKQSQPEY